MPRLPDIVIIGAQKAGSTFVQQAIQDHPGAWMPRGETPFFEDPHYKPGTAGPFFDHLLAPAEANAVTGIKRPNYLGRPEVPARMAADLRGVKLVVVLRDPVARAVSGYFHYMKTCLIPVQPIEVGMRQLLAGELTQRYPRAADVLDFGFYGRHLERYLQHFPRERLHVVLFADLRDRPLEVVREVYEFIGVDPDVQPQRLEERPMAAMYSLPRLRVNAALRRLDMTTTADGSGVRRCSGPLAGAARAVRVALDRWLLAPLLPQDKPSLPPDLHEELAEHYRVDVATLRDLLANPLPDWPSSAGRRAL